MSSWHRKSYLAVIVHQYARTTSATSQSTLENSIKVCRFDLFKLCLFRMTILEWNRHPKDERQGQTFLAFSNFFFVMFLKMLYWSIRNISENLTERLKFVLGIYHNSVGAILIIISAGKRLTETQNVSLLFLNCWFKKCFVSGLVSSNFRAYEIFLSSFLSGCNFGFDLLIVSKKFKNECEFCFRFFKWLQSFQFRFQSVFFQKLMFPFLFFVCFRKENVSYFVSVPQKIKAMKTGFCFSCFVSLLF